MWSVNANITWYKNKVTRLPDEHKTMTVDGVDGYSSGNYFYGEGEPLYTWRIKRWAGVNPECSGVVWGGGRGKEARNGCRCRRPE